MVISLERPAGCWLHPSPFPLPQPKAPTATLCSAFLLFLCAGSVLPVEIHPAGLELSGALFVQHSSC